VLVLPTGGGKTVVFSRLPDTLRDFLQAFPEGQRKTYILAHRDELIEQAAAKLEAANPDLAIGIEAGDRRSRPLDDIVVASVQTLKGRRLEQIDPVSVRVVVVDEAHHAAAGSYQTILRYFGLLPPPDLLPRDTDSNHAPARAAVQAWWQQNNPNRLLLGVTATPERSDAIGLEWTFRQVVYEKTLRWMIEQGFLAPPRGFLVETDLVLDAVKTTAGDFNQRQLADTVNTAERNRLAVEGWLDRARGRPTIAFCVDIKHAEDMAQMFRDFGVRADVVHGNLPKDERAARIAALGTGMLDVVTNCNVLTEGTDIPQVSCLVMAKPTKSRTLYTQMIGRGLRRLDGKADCIVLDVVDVARRHSIATAGDLFGLPFKIDAQGRDLVAVAKRLEDVKQQYPTLDLTGVANLDEIRKRIQSIDLWAVRESAIVNEYAKLLWIEEAGGERFTVALPERADENKALVTRERVGIRRGMLGNWLIDVITRDGDTNIATADTVEEAFTKAERWIEFNRPEAFSTRAKDAPWRARPATAKQLAFLTRLGAPVRPDMTRGEASLLMDQFFARRS
jgi:ATP-dependent helicase IRC3